MTRRLHIYIPKQAHSTMVLVGDEGGLTKLRNAIDMALKRPKELGYGFVCAADGEYYDILVCNTEGEHREDGLGEENVWANISLPYENFSQEHLPDLIKPMKVLTMKRYQHTMELLTRGEIDDDDYL